MERRKIYLDNAATTPVNERVYDAISDYYRKNFYNPSANYTPAYNIAKEIERTRKTLATYIGCKPEEIFFTSGASESNSWAIQGWLRSHSAGYVVTTNIEHHSIMAISEDPYYESNICVIGVDDDGILHEANLQTVLEEVRGWGVQPDDILVAIQTANNEIGTIQPIYDLARITKNFGAHFFTDATQAFAGIDMEKFLVSSNIDMMSMSGHKIGAPKGVGFLYKSKDIELPPLIYGTQNYGLRGGTENVPAIIAMYYALQHIDIVKSRFCNVEQARDKLFEELNKITPIKMNGSKEHRLPNNLNITFEKEIIGTTIMAVLSALDVYISVGSACNAQTSEPSHVLTAIGLSEDEALRTIRITLPDDANIESVSPIAYRFKTAIELLLRE